MKGLGFASVISLGLPPLGEIDCLGAAITGLVLPSINPVQQEPWPRLEDLFSARHISAEAWDTLRGVWGGWYVKTAIDAIFHDPTRREEILGTIIRQTPITDIYAVSSQLAPVLMQPALLAILEIEAGKDPMHPTAMLLAHQREVFNYPPAVNVLCSNYGALPGELRGIIESKTRFLWAASWPPYKAAQEYILRYHPELVEDYLRRQGIDSIEVQKITRHVRSNIHDIIGELESVSKQVPLLSSLRPVVEDQCQSSLITLRAPLSPASISAPTLASTAKVHQPLILPQWSREPGLRVSQH